MVTPAPRHNRIVNADFEEWMGRVTPEDQLREWVYRQAHSPQDSLLFSSARVACAVETGWAEEEGYPFSPIYWYYTPETGPIMTLWDVRDA